MLCDVEEAPNVMKIVLNVEVVVEVVPNVMDVVLKMEDCIEVPKVMRLCGSRRVQLAMVDF